MYPIFLNIPNIYICIINILPLKLIYEFSQNRNLYIVKHTQITLSIKLQKVTKRFLTNITITVWQFLKSPLSIRLCSQLRRLVVSSVSENTLSAILSEAIREQTICSMLALRHLSRDRCLSSSCLASLHYTIK